MKVYIAKPHSTFDAGTEVELLEDYRGDSQQDYIGEFFGMRDGTLIAAVCLFKEFWTRYIPEQGARNAGGQRERNHPEHP